MDNTEIDNKAEVVEEAVETVEPAVEAVEPLEETDTTEQVIGLEFPEGMEEGIKDYITGIEDETARKAHFDKFKNFNDGYLKKFEAVAADRKAVEAQKTEMETSNHFYGGYKALEQTLGEHKGSIEANFGSSPAYFKWLHEQNVAISDDPVNYALRLLKGSGIDETNIAETFNGDSQKAYQQNNDLGRFKEQLTQSTQKQMQDWQEQQLLNGFINETNAEGGLKHPHFETIKGVMGSLQGAYPQASYEQLYDMACKTDPDISTDYLQSKVTQEAAKIVNKKEVAKAKNVVGVKSSVDSVGKKENLGWREQLRNDIEADAI